MKCAAAAHQQKRLGVVLFLCATWRSLWNPPKQQKPGELGEMGSAGWQSHSHDSGSCKLSLQMLIQSRLPHQWPALPSLVPSMDSVPPAGTPPPAAPGTTFVGQWVPRALPCLQYSPPCLSSQARCPRNKMVNSRAVGKPGKIIMLMLLLSFSSRGNGALCSVWGSTFLKGLIGKKSSWESNEGDKGLENRACEGKTKRAGHVQSGEERAEGTHNCLRVC